MVRRLFGRTAALGRRHYQRLPVPGRAWSGLVRDEDDLAGDAARLGVAQGGGGEV
jgi:hypothetical protein